MKNTGKIAGILLLLFIAGNLSLSAQRGMRGMRPDSTGMNRMRMNQMQMPLLMQNPDSLKMGSMGHYKGPGRMNKMGRFMCPMCPMCEMGLQAKGNWRQGRGINQEPGMQQRGPGMRGMARGMRHMGSGMQMMAPGTGRPGMGQAMQRQAIRNRQAAQGMRVIENIPNLTDKQKKDIAELRQKQQEEMQKLREGMQEKVKDLRESNKTKVLSLLTSEQKKWLEEYALEHLNR